MKVLVCGPAWVGDMVMAQSLYKQIRLRYPDAVIDVLAPTWSFPLLNRMPEVNRGVELPIGHGKMHLSGRIRLGRELAENRYDVAIVTQRSWKSALIPFFAGIPVRTGYLGEMRFILINNRRPLDKTKLTQTVQRLVALGCPENAAMPPDILPPELRIDSANLRRTMESLGLDRERPVAAVFPGAEYGPAKQWPLDYFREIALKLTETGYQVWIMGGPNDAMAGGTIARGNLPHIHNLIGRTRLKDAIDLISLAKFAVTNDSGLMHVAAAVGVHVEAIYGSSTPDYTPPLTDRKTVHYLRLPCSPCFERECPLGHKNCLKHIPVARVIDSATGRESG